MNILPRFLELLISKPMHSIAEDNNIIGIYDRSAGIIVTKDDNYAIGFEIGGLSYGGLTPEDEEALHLTRKIFFAKNNPNIRIDISVKKESLSLEHHARAKNPHSSRIIQRWENNFNAYRLSYYLILSTKNKGILSFLEEKREKMTTEGGENSLYKIEQLKDAAKMLELYLGRFRPRALDGEELMNVYASYCNMSPTLCSYKDGYLRDSYIDSNILFKRDYIIHERDGSEIYSRYIAIKAYDTEEISSSILSTLFNIPVSMNVLFQIQSISKESVLWKVSQKIKMNSQNELVVAELDTLLKELQSDREMLLYFSFAVMVSAKTQEELNQRCNEVKAALVAKGLIAVRETLNQQPLYFSFFPGRTINSRTRLQSSTAISTILTFEKDIEGFSQNSWGESPVTIFKNITETPYFFNFHMSPGKDCPNGHTLVIGNTYAGKTTFMSFLMTCLTKFEIDIFALDKLRGMHNFCTFLGGDYSDINDEFRLNPFSLAPTHENSLFLNSFLRLLGNIDEREYEEVNAIADTLERIYENSENITLLDFYESLERVPNLKHRYKSHLDGIFAHPDDALSFQKQITILNMDSVLKDEIKASHLAYYVFHKILYQAKTKGKGAFVFVDELKDYLANDVMAHKLLETILEIRKLNGVVALGVQNLDFFDNIKNASSWINSMAHFAIFPTTNTESIQKHIELTPAELRFLKNTNPLERKLLWKNANTKESVILDVNLSRLREYLRVFSSSAEDVLQMKALLAEGEGWREKYLQREG
ncbi:VirB4-like protein [Wolinella succinogenes]|uniref:VIRB4 HOMOLOG n=1 Tax=Wolinella succinogenes (strain ATCC 29543 / DSM 1740 / CCUG 13145 / JCM 31913 / LMG 7466 / NCTC 11488 / FDC 602W) TaxID=273121 RepID=Q7M993_WOLSU|nr:VirB4-like protein [Wolinella succinogenes]CAE10192.1 VIRB4 HOMOLOG [Wolinella succinogenes]VEG82406.1 Type IV secretion system protein virB4 [Wolinella succinogenes]